MAVVGPERYGHGDLAAEVADRWPATNRTQFERSGKVLEKYDVRDPTAEAGGGEYELRDGFGWTNGVALALIDRYSGNRTRCRTRTAPTRRSMCEWFRRPPRQ